MKPKTRRRLALEKEYVRVLTASELARPAGGFYGSLPCYTEDCPCKGQISYEE